MVSYTVRETRTVPWISGGIKGVHRGEPVMMCRITASPDYFQRMERATGGPVGVVEHTDDPHRKGNAGRSFNSRSESGSEWIARLTKKTPARDDDESTMDAHSRKIRAANAKVMEAAKGGR